MKQNNNILTRSYRADFSINEDSRTIHGLAIPINSRSEFLHEDDGNYYEIILPEAINDDLINKNDVRVYLDHDMTQGTFARSKYGEGSLRLEITERGLEFEFEAPNTVFGNALLEGIKRGDYDAMSFGFIPGKERWEKDENGQPLHVIRSIDFLFEISILSLLPAFSATDVDLRSLKEFKDAENQKVIDKLNERMADINNLLSDINIQN